MDIVVLFPQVGRRSINIRSTCSPSRCHAHQPFVCAIQGRISHVQEMQMTAVAKVEPNVEAW